jgi:hypothetical protein
MWDFHSYQQSHEKSHGIKVSMGFFLTKEKNMPQAFSIWVCFPYLLNLGESLPHSVSFPPTLFTNVTLSSFCLKLDILLH